jgi:peptidoglycan/xylan/chitin deacetylase (PgdA/CDA1 family)
MTISPARFDRQIEYIAKRHRIVGLDEALSLLTSGTKLRKPVAVIAFDDAYETVYTHAAPILQSRKAVGTCFAATGFLDTDRRYLHDSECAAKAYANVMTWAELRELHAEGWTIGSHTVNHVRLSECEPAVLASELGESKSALDAAFGRVPTALAYPFGSRADITDEAISVSKQFGYAAILGDFGGENFPGMDLFALNRVDIGANHATLMWKLYAHGYDLGAVRHLFAPISRRF